MLYVKDLSYVLVESKTVRFNNPPAIEGEEASFRYRLAEGRLTVEMTDHLAEAEARGVVEAWLARWEVWAAAKYAIADFRLVFEGSLAVETEPADPAVPMRVSKELVTSWNVLAAPREVSTYPAVPGTFALSPDVATMVSRWRGYRAGREPLLSMAYFCLTVVEKVLAKSRAEAARKYAIHLDVLRELGRITANRGDAINARKAYPGFRPLTANEEAFVESVILALVRRVGERAAEPTRVPSPNLTLADFPAVGAD